MRKYALPLVLMLIVSFFAAYLTGCAGDTEQGPAPATQSAGTPPASSAAPSSPEEPNGEPLASPSDEPAGRSSAAPDTDGGASPEPEDSVSPENTPRLREPDQILADMTLEEKVGQMLMPRCPESGAVKAVSDYKPCGFVLFGRDFRSKTAEQVKNTLQSYQDAADIPLILSTDEEGGVVVRISGNKNLARAKFPSPRQLFLSREPNAVHEDSVYKAMLLISLGVNANLAPVADVSTNSKDFIYSRTLGESAEETADFVSEVVKSTQNQNVSSTLKHFPGYGPNPDTHTKPNVDNRPIETFRKSDFLPFIAGIEAGAYSVLVSHNIVTCMDSKLPASLSPEVHRILREELKFDGVIMTDDLDMEAVAQRKDEHPIAVMAVLAGNDLVLNSDFKKAHADILEAVNSGVISESRIDESVLRILGWKKKLGLF